MIPNHNILGLPESDKYPTLREYPYLEAEDIAEALSYAAWRAEEVEVALRQP